MKPVGLADPRTGREPYAVVQLRRDSLAGDHLNLVGFQSRLKWGEQERVFRLVPALARARFVRLGQVHRNTYVDAPRLLRPTFQLRSDPALFLAGQLAGVEGYIESTASGLVAGWNAARLARGLEPLELPRTTVIGALAHYVAHAEPEHFVPAKAAFGYLDAPAERRRRDRRAAYAPRSLADLDAVAGRAWAEEGVETPAGTQPASAPAKMER
jgi:methylenetetrahydrofolate--tRNA-(uracil-5-)-methyltransferase